jgi:hypothetical protein
VHNATAESSYSVPTSVILNTNQNADRMYGVLHYGFYSSVEVKTVWRKRLKLNSSTASENKEVDSTKVADL